MKPVFLILTIAILTSCGSPQNADGDATRSTRLDSALVAQSEKSGFNGCLTVAINDSIIYSRSTGLANIVHDISITDSTRFDIASLNKSFIAALVLIAVEEGYFSLDDRLTTLLSDLHYTGEFHDSITIHQLLCHTSGLPDYSGIADVFPELARDNFKSFKKTHYTNQEYIDFISQLPPAGEPGNQFYYSNFGYHVLCILLEETYHNTFSEILTEKITAPLGLQNTLNVLDYQLVPGLAIAYTQDELSGNWQENDYIDLSLGRRIFSTTEDLLKWAQAIQSGEILSESSTKSMLSNQLESITDQFSYGYGWVIFERGDRFRKGDLQIDQSYFIHGGQTGGYKSMLANIDDGSVIISMLTNTGTELDETEFLASLTNTIYTYNEH